MKEIWIREEIKEKDHFCTTSEWKGRFISVIYIQWEGSFTDLVRATTVANFSGLLLVGACAFKLEQAETAPKPQGIFLNCYGNKGQTKNPVLNISNFVCSEIQI